MEKLILHYPAPPEEDFEPPEDPTWSYDCDSYADYKQYMLEHLSQKRKSMGGVSRPVAAKGIVMRDVLIPGYREEIRLRIYSTEEKGQNCPGLLYIHGGGWYGGTIWGPEEFLKGISAVCGAVVVSVDYHLAPEHPFPEGLFDCREAMYWMDGHKAELGIGEISVGGDSAGGNLAAGLCLLLRDEGFKTPKNQILLYPAVAFTDELLATPFEDADEEEDVPFAVKDNWPGKVIRDWYFGQSTEYDNPYVSPLCAENLSGLPSAVVVTCEFDGLMEQGQAYAEKLDSFGVQLRLWHFENTFHGFADDTGTDPQGLDLIYRLKDLI